MTKKTITGIFNQMKIHQALINDKKRLLKAFESKRGVSSISNANERVQSSNSRETGQNLVSERIIELEREIEALESKDLSDFYLLVTSNVLEDREQLIIMLYYAEDLSYRQTARQFYIKKKVHPHHSTIKEWIESAIDKLSATSDSNM